MDSIHKTFNFNAGDDSLHIPCVVNVAKMAPESIDKLLSTMTEHLGAKYFREKDLFMEVLSDKVAATKKPFAFLYGPFIGIFIKDNDEVRVASYDAPEGGMTVYSEDQFHQLASQIDGPLKVEDAVRRKSPRP